MTKGIAVLIVAFFSGFCLPCQGQTVGPETLELKRIACDLVDRLSKGDFAGATKNFDNKMKNALPADKLEQVWQSILAQVGPYEHQLAVRSGKVGPADVVYVGCKFKKAVLDAKVVFANKKQVAGLWFVPSQTMAGKSPKSLPKYLKSDAFEEIQVSIGHASKALPGILTLPKGPGPFPAIVLVHGSGPHDRDETIGPNKPFRDLGRGLAVNGLAVLRYDKRSKVFPAQMLAIMDKLTVKEETIDDTLAAVQLLRETEQIDPDKIYVFGHSLGGFVAPRIGKQDRRIAGLIIMAGTTRPLEDVILDQFNYISRLDGEISPDEKANLDVLELQVARVKDPKLSVARFAAKNLPLGIPKSYWRDLRAYQPVEMARGLSQPILVLQGGRDYQVTKADYDGWRKGLSAKRNVRFRLYPNLNHLFMEGQGRSTPAEYERPGYVSEQVIRDISQWVQELSRSPRPGSILEKQP